MVDFAVKWLHWTPHRSWGGDSKDLQTHTLQAQPALQAPLSKCKLKQCDLWAWTEHWPVCPMPYPKKKRGGEGGHYCCQPDNQHVGLILIVLGAWVMTCLNCEPDLCNSCKAIAGWAAGRELSKSRESTMMPLCCVHSCLTRSLVLFTKHQPKYHNALGTPHRNMTAWVRLHVTWGFVSSWIRLCITHIGFKLSVDLQVWFKSTTGSK